MSLGLDHVSILHVDDEPDYGDLVATFLKKHNDKLVVETVHSPAEALEQLGSNDYDCIVSDYDMPGTNGIEFLEQVREHHPDLPFILYTGKGSEEIASDAISAGVTDYLQKGSGTGQYTVLANRIENAVEQYHAKRSVFEAEEKLAQIANKTDDILYMFDSDWSELLFINSAYEDIWGGSEEQLRENPESFLDHIHPADREIAVESVQKLADGTPDTVEYRVNMEQDGWRWVRGESKPIFDEEGEVDRIVGFVRDITAQKHQHDRLKKTSARLEAIFENSPELIAIHDADGDIHDYNERFKTELGYSETELREMKVWDLDTDASPERAREFWDTLPPNSPRRFEGVLQRRDGSEFPVEIHLIRMDLAGKDRFVAMDRDITEQKERERRLIRQNERLDDFTSMISHDLRNPLEVAQGRLELLEHESEHVDAIRTALDRMDAMISDLLTLAHEGTDALDVARVDLETPARRAWETVDRADTALTIETTTHVSADPDQLQQLFENLFRNSIEHGGEDITITVGSLENGFYVEDDGRGVPEEHRDDIFDVGYSTTRGGTGYGLNIVTQICDNHGWEISVSNSEMGGARFEIEGTETANPQDRDS